MEVDFVINTQKEIVFIEVKFTENIQKSNLRSLKIFMEDYKCQVGYITSLHDYKKIDSIINIPVYFIEKGMADEV